jgi:hypothetical protein
MTLDDRLRRDETAAGRAQTAAQEVLHGHGASTESVDLRSGLTHAQRQRQTWRSDRDRTLAGIANHPFQAMMEVITELHGPNGALEEKSQLWYANETSTTNEVFGTGSERINVLAWSHPGVQLALSGKLHEFHDISASRYRLAGVEPIGRAHFAAVLPEISGLYEPGGPVRPAVPFNVARTRVFLANANLVAYSRKMLVEQLDIPDRVVELVDPFVDDLLNRFWTFTHGARPRQRRLTVLEEEARRAYFGLCRAEMLATLWQAYERQISERLTGVSETMWVKRSLDSKGGPLSAALARALAACGGRKIENGDPLASRLRLDSIYREVQRPTRLSGKRLALTLEKRSMNPSNSSSLRSTIRSRRSPPHSGRYAWTAVGASPAEPGTKRAKPKC